jgi:hypothetical protein
MQTFLPVNVECVVEETYIQISLIVTIALLRFRFYGMCTPLSAGKKITSVSECNASIFRVKQSKNKEFLDLSHERTGPYRRNDGKGPRFRD